MVVKFSQFCMVIKRCGKYLDVGKQWTRFNMLRDDNLRKFQQLPIADVMISTDCRRRVSTISALHVGFRGSDLCLETSFHNCGFYLFSSVYPSDVRMVLQYYVTNGSSTSYTVLCSLCPQFDAVGPHAQNVFNWTVNIVTTRGLNTAALHSLSSCICFNVTEFLI